MIIYILLLFIIIIIFLSFNKRETFSNNDYCVDIPYIDKEKGIIMTNDTFSLPETIDPAWGESYGENSLPKIDNSYFLDDGADGKLGLLNNMCSPLCCEQQPLPFKLKYDESVFLNKNKFVPSNYFCRNAYQGAGCMCMTKEQKEFLINRGGNAS